MENKNIESFITIADLWNICVARWRWFAASVLVAVLLAVYYLSITPFLYTRQAALLVIEETLGKNSTEQNGDAFNNIGFVNQSSNVTNVLRHITSLSVLTEVVHRLYPSIENPNEVIDKAKDIQSRLSATNEDFKSTIIDLTYRDYSTEEAERVLTTIIQAYHDTWLANKRKMTQKTSQFIDERLTFLRDELDIVDDSIAVFKSNYGITDLTHVSDIYLGQQRESDAAIMKLTSQKEMAEFIRELLEDESSPRQLLLVNSGIDNSGIEAQITLYNNLT